jgi:hypothetical protein
MSLRGVRTTAKTNRRLDGIVGNTMESGTVRRKL